MLKLFSLCFNFSGNNHKKLINSYSGRCEWIQSSIYEPAPFGAVVGGSDIDGSIMYVGRCPFRNNILPCKVMPDENLACCSYDNDEYYITYYDILCNGNVSWVNARDGNVPKNAIPGGRTDYGETLYIGRVLHEGYFCVGKIHPSNGCCYIPFGGGEYKYEFYDALVEN